MSSYHFSRLTTVCCCLVIVLALLMDYYCRPMITCACYFKEIPWFITIIMIGLLLLHLMCFVDRTCKMFIKHRIKFFHLLETANKRVISIISFDRRIGYWYCSGLGEPPVPPLPKSNAELMVKMCKEPLNIKMIIRCLIPFTSHLHSCGN